VSLPWPLEHKPHPHKHIGNPSVRVPYGTLQIHMEVSHYYTKLYYIYNLLYYTAMYYTTLLSIPSTFIHRDSSTPSLLSLHQQRPDWPKAGQSNSKSFGSLSSAKAEEHMLDRRCCQRHIKYQPAYGTVHQWQRPLDASFPPHSCTSQPITLHA
jgi:hypothetical protein